MLTNTIAELEGMTAEQQEELLSVQFSEDMVKQAEAEVDAMTLAEACFSLGELKAERAVAEVEGLDKVASAEDIAAHDAAVTELGEDIDALVGSLGLANLEDQVALHKEAQAAAGLIFQGYVSTLDKLAEGKMREAVEKLVGHARKGMSAAGSHMGKHKKKYIGGAAGLAALGTGAAVHHHMKKKASELTGADLVEIMDARDAVANSFSEIEEGSEKLAAAASEAGKTMGAKLKALAAKHPKKLVGAAAGGAGLLGGYAAGRAQK